MTDMREKPFGGELTIDPTENVKALALASAERQDDLRELNDRRIDAEIRIQTARLDGLENRMIMRADHAKEIRLLETARLDSIRQVDREEVAKTAMAANRAIETLATAASVTAETLRNQVASTTKAQADTHAASMAEVNKRLTAVELVQSEGRGKQTVADPMMTELVAEMKALRISGASQGGQSQGAKSLWLIIAGILALLFTFMFGAAGLIIAIINMKK